MRSEPVIREQYERLVEMSNSFDDEGKPTKIPKWAVFKAQMMTHVITWILGEDGDSTMTPLRAEFSCCCFGTHNEEDHTHKHPLGPQYCVLSHGCIDATEWDFLKDPDWQRKLSL